MTPDPLSQRPPGSYSAPAPLSATDLERVLRRVRKPARYAGGEWNEVRKDWSETALKWCLAYPDLYEIGMSNLGVRILYEILNESAGTLAERCFAPESDLADLLRDRHLPLWSLETRRPLRAFDVLGFSIGYELTYTNMLEMLDLAGVPLLAAERREADPLVIAGGSCVLNPEPIADFLDAVVMGEGEEVVVEISELLTRLDWHRRDRFGSGEGVRSGEGARPALLRALASIPGVYVPSLYEPRFDPDGTYLGTLPRDPAAPKEIAHRVAPDFETRARPIRQLVPNLGIVFDRAQIEVMRGCTRGCRFCQAGIWYRPVRERDPEVAIEAVDAVLKATGYEEIGLTSLSTADYTHIAAVARAIHQSHPQASVSIPSTRVDALSVELLDAIAPGGRNSGFTFAPEAGSQRLRDVINKGVSDEEIVSCAELAFGRGYAALKLYFMIGLPGETIDDVRAIGELCRQIGAAGRRCHGNRAQIKVKVSAFVPKVMTPFAWVGQDTTEELAAKVAVLHREIRGHGLDLAWHDPSSAMIEAALGRGDRRVAGAILRAWRDGARMEAWDERFSPGRWQAAFAAEGLDAMWYAQRDIPLDEPLPWEHLAGPVSMEFLRRDYKRSLAGKTLPDCHWGACYACGVPAATSFTCNTGERGPRALLRQEAVP